MVRTLLCATILINSGMDTEPENINNPDRRLRDNFETTQTILLRIQIWAFVVRARELEQNRPAVR